MLPLAKGRKTPRHHGWQKIDYSLHSDIGPWGKSDGNLGVRLRDSDLVIDMDPRNFESGDDPLTRLGRISARTVSASPRQFLAAETAAACTSTFRNSLP